MARALLTTPVAVIDCGTNSTRLLIRAGSVTLERRIVTTRLGRSTDRTGHLDADGVARTLEALAEYRDVVEAHGARRVRAVATQAVREATDGHDFVARATEVLGTPVEVLSGEEEGRLAFVGATSEVDEADGPFLVLDIGGGSTELSVGTTTCEGSMSIPVGSVRITEQQLASDPPAPEELEQRVRARRRLSRRRPPRDALRARREHAPRHGRHDHDHGCGRDRARRVRPRRHPSLRADDVRRPRTCSARSPPNGSPIACTTRGCDRDRADIIVGGCCVLVAVMRRLDFKECIVCETDLLDGIADELIALAS